MGTGQKALPLLSFTSHKVLHSTWGLPGEALQVLGEQDMALPPQADTSLAMLSSPHTRLLSVLFSLAGDSFRKPLTRLLRDLLLFVRPT